MSLRLALQVVGALVVGYLLFVTIVAMGPIGWAIFVPLLAIGTVQVYRNRTRDDGSAGSPNYCPNCGSALEYDSVGEETDDGGWAVRYCPDCGAPLGSDGDADRDGRADETSGAERPANCPDCGAPNDPDRTTCDYCDTAL
ncbi:zinc ribbon domain-containing protein [Haloterrigena sp. SYSU A558-1]|uniref:Zinc ribbon domain-containing protein n=1 Tax=Haloterrigena gelatinilytica TaxID=2741724 RepID=A0A8J8GTD0_9EURY|nr:zinc ribbon domain-containing protein [Haloterrigena gelatinilytica]NUB93095.1 zinc ribbon domain-containing protein [Haloterrigena gelatinilytica]NUC70995.1 zinc ribbon domain-containing protein [Haloterrigena gelatinilytica]